MVRASAADTTPMVVQLIPLVISKINETLHINAASGVDAAERQREMQVRCRPVAGEGCGGCWAAQLLGARWRDASRGSAECHLSLSCCRGCVCVRPMPLPSALAPTDCVSLPLPLPLPFSLQGLLCGMTLVIVQKLSESEVAKGGVLQYADHIMKALLDVFACRTASVHEEAMLAVVRGLLGRRAGAELGWAGGWLAVVRVSRGRRRSEMAGWAWEKKAGGDTCWGMEGREWTGHMP